MFISLEGFYRQGEFEAKVTFEQNFNTYYVSNIDFARIETPEDLDNAGRMLIEVGEVLAKLRGDTDE